jgi:hypothetical protein
VKKGSSGVQRAADHVQAFQNYLDGLRKRGEALPLRAGGDPNLSQIAKDSGIGDRARFYTNERLKDMLATAVASVPRVAAPTPTTEQPKPIDTEAQRRAERRAQKLEQANAALVAENAELRRQLRDLRLQLGREDMIIETGRRIPPPEAG